MQYPLEKSILGHLNSHLYSLSMLPCLSVPSVKQKGGKAAQQTKASRETHLLKNKEQHKGNCEERKAQRGASLTTDHSKSSCPDTQLVLERAFLKENFFLLLKVSCRKERGKTEK